MSVLIFSGKCVFLGRLSWEEFPEKTWKGGVLNYSPAIWGIFQKLPEKLRGRGGGGYTVHVSRVFITLLRNRGRALIMYICGIGLPEGNGKIRTYFPSPKKRKETKGTRSHLAYWSQDRGSTGKSSIERGWIFCGKIRERSVSFPEIGGGGGSGDRERA